LINVDAGFRKFWWISWISWISIFRPTVLQRGMGSFPSLKLLKNT